MEGFVTFDFMNDFDNLTLIISFLYIPIKYCHPSNCQQSFKPEQEDCPRGCFHYHDLVFFKVAVHILCKSI